MIQFQAILELLAGYGVRFIVIGGVAAGAHGSSQATFDLDVWYARDRENLERLGRAMISVNARLRNAPPGLPFKADAETLRRGLNFTFETDLGKLDLLGVVDGITAGFEEAMAAALMLEMSGRRYAIISLPELIASKRAAGRTKDLLALPELEAILEYQQKLKHGDDERFESEE
jgi:predicted nucleotidyltransferase